MLRNLFCICTAAGWLVILFPLALLFMLVSLSTDASIWLARRWWAPVLLWAGGAKLKIFGQENLDPIRPAIYVCNHQSTIDIPALFVAIPLNLRFVAKKQLRWVPLLGWYMWLAGYVFIDRGNHRSALASLDIAGEKIRAGTNIVMFPEGTRSEDGRILPFKKGPFALAALAKVPIYPVTIEGSGKLMPKNRWTITPGDITVMIGKAIEPHEFAQLERDDLVRLVRNRIIEQSLQMGGRGGDVEQAIAARGIEGVAARSEEVKLA